MDDMQAGPTSTPVNDAVEPTTTESLIAAPTDTATEQPSTDTTAEAPAVPEAYDFAMPEGMDIDQGALDEFSSVAKELKLDQGTAQKVADIAIKMISRQQEAHVELVNTWTESTKADKELGGERLQENLAVAKKALDAFGTPELKDVLNMTGLGNHPEIIRAFYKAGKAISEDRFIPGAPKGVEMDPAKRLFPSMA